MSVLYLKCVTYKDNLQALGVIVGGSMQEINSNLPNISTNTEYPSQMIGLSQQTNQQVQ